MLFYWRDTLENLIMYNVLKKKINSKNMIRIGIICPSEIAFRRFLPALQKDKRFEFAGIGIASPNEWFGDIVNISQETIDNQQNKEHDKAQKFIDIAGGKIYNGYESLVKSDDIDAVYIPLPPALHYKWTKLALESEKHVFVEKPSTTEAKDTTELISIAKNNGLALHENYMFIYHDQLKYINDVIASGEIGDVRLYRITFGFPRRKQNDFRYSKNLGGGALIDAGGYTIRYATYLLGMDVTIKTAQLNYENGFEVDMYGSATMSNSKGITAQLAFGMDNDYKCEIEIWGSKGTINSNRILTAPAGFVPEYTIKKNQDYEIRKLPTDDAFYKSIVRFFNCIVNSVTRDEEYTILQKQANLISQFKDITK